MPEHKNQHKKYFYTKTTPKRVVQVVVNEEAATKSKRYFGFFSLITNESMDSITVFEIYQNKDVIEKTFGNLKEKLNIRHILSR